MNGYETIGKSYHIGTFESRVQAEQALIENDFKYTKYNTWEKPYSRAMISRCLMEIKKEG